MSQPFKTYKIKDFDILFFKTRPSFGNPDEYTILVYDDGVGITIRCDGVDCDVCPLGRQNSPTHKTCPSYPTYLYHYNNLQKPRKPQ